MRNRARGRIYANYFAADTVKDMDMGIVVNYCTQLHKANDPPPIPVVEEMS
jgi:hypothetical protein